MGTVKISNHLIVVFSNTLMTIVLHMLHNKVYSRPYVLIGGSHWTYTCAPVYQIWQHGYRSKYKNTIKILAVYQNLFWTKYLLEQIKCTNALMAKNVTFINTVQTQGTRSIREDTSICCCHRKHTCRLCHIKALHFAHAKGSTCFAGAMEWSRLCSCYETAFRELSLKGKHSLCSCQGGHPLSSCHEEHFSLLMSSVRTLHSTSRSVNK